MKKGVEEIKGSGERYARKLAASAGDLLGKGYEIGEAKVSKGSRCISGSSLFPKREKVLVK